MQEKYHHKACLGSGLIRMAVGRWLLSYWTAHRTVWWLTVGKVFDNLLSWSTVRHYTIN